MERIDPVRLKYTEPKKLPFAGWRQRQRQREYLDDNEDEIVADIHFGLSIREIAKKHRLNLSLLERWLEDMGLIPAPQVVEEPVIEMPKLPDPPKLVEGKKYRLKDREKGEFEHVTLRYIGSQCGKCVGGRFFLFQNSSGGKYAFHLLQLLECFAGESK